MRYDPFAVRKEQQQQQRNGHLQTATQVACGNWPSKLRNKPLINIRRSLLLPSRNKRMCVSESKATLLSVCCNNNTNYKCNLTWRAGQVIAGLLTIRAAARSGRGQVARQPKVDQLKRRQQFDCERLRCVCFRVCVASCLTFCFGWRRSRSCPFGGYKRSCFAARRFTHAHTAR